MINYSSLKEKLNIEPCVEDTDDVAFFTHYLHNYDDNIPKHFQIRANDYYFNHIGNSNFIEEPQLDALLPIKWDIPFPAPENPEFTFIDLFAGIGGFRIPMQGIGGKCVFSSEYNYHAQRAYELNFGDVPFGDITKLDVNIIPNHDILCAGFPCQPFSISGKMKGFEDTRGTLIYYVFKIIEKCQPKVVLLENVKHLLYHDKRRTLSIIIKHLEELGYLVSKKVLNATDFGLPQNRERIIIVGHKDAKFDFTKVVHLNKTVLRDFLDKSNDFEYLDEPYTILPEHKSQESGLVFAGYRNKTIRKAGVRPGTEHLSRVHKQPNRIYSTEGVHPALPSQESSGRFWIFHDQKVRKLTIQECYRIMGFPKEFKMINSKAELYKQIGNSVAIPMIKAVAEQIKIQLLTNNK